MNTKIKKKIKLILVVLIGIPCLLCFFKGVKTLCTYRALDKQYESIKSDMNNSIKNSSIAVTDGTSVEKSLNSIDGLSSVDLVSQLDSTSYELIKTISANTIHETSDCVVEFTFSSKDVVSSLASLSTKMLVCNYINVNGSSITIRVTIGGGK